LWSSLGIAAAVEQCPDSILSNGYGYWNYLSGLKLGNAMLSSPDSCPLVSDAISVSSAPLANVIYSDDTYGPSSAYVALRHNNGQITAFLDTHVAYATTIPSAPFPPGSPATLTGNAGVSVNGDNVYEVDTFAWGGGSPCAWSTNTLAGSGFLQFNLWPNAQFGSQVSAGIAAAAAGGAATTITNESQMLACVRFWGSTAQVYGPGSYGGGHLLWTDTGTTVSTDVWHFARTGTTVTVSKNNTVVATVSNISGPIEFAAYMGSSDGITNVTMSTY
jgi:hypothetical protein